MDIIENNTMDSEKKNITDLSIKTPEVISFFDKDTDFVLAYKKTEKLASAIYLVTNLFSDNEPMKWTLRRKSSDLVSLSLTYKDVSELVRTDFVYEVKTRVLESVSLLEIASRAGLVSHMNFSILKQEFHNLIAIFSNAELSIKSPLNRDISKIFSNDPTQIGSLRYDQNKSHSGHENETSSRLSLIDVKDKSIPTPKDDLKRSNRQNTIIALLKKKKELNIKDIALVIKDCSEKTIQRELNSFIATGVIKRAGVRRWSKYSLV